MHLTPLSVPPEKTIGKTASGGSVPSKDEWHRTELKGSGYDASKVMDPVTTQPSSAHGSTLGDGPAPSSAAVPVQVNLNEPYPLSAPAGMLSQGEEILAGQRPPVETGLSEGSGDLTTRSIDRAKRSFEALKTTIGQFTDSAIFGTPGDENGAGAGGAMGGAQEVSPDVAKAKLRNTFKRAVRKASLRSTTMRLQQRVSVLKLASRTTENLTLMSNTRKSVYWQCLCIGAALLLSVPWKECNDRLYHRTYGRVITEALACACVLVSLLQVYWTYKYYEHKNKSLLQAQLATPNSGLWENGLFGYLAMEAAFIMVGPLPMVHFTFDAHAKSGYDAVINEDILAVFVCLRLYIIPRLLCYQGLLTSTKIRFLGTLNDVDFDFPFVLKSYLRIHPLRMIFSSLVVTVVFAGYALEICEADLPKPEAELYLVHWLYYIWSITLGGVYEPSGSHPETLYGEMIVFVASFLGLVITSTLIAVIAQSMALNFAESKVVDNMKVDEVRGQVKEASVKMLQRYWRDARARREGQRRGGAFSPRGLMSGFRLIGRPKRAWRSGNVFQALRKLKAVKRKQKTTKDADLICTLLDEVFSIKSNLADLKDKWEAKENKELRDKRAAKRDELRCNSIANSSIGTPR